jgi:hypothetical protein
MINQDRKHVIIINKKNFIPQMQVAIVVDKWCHDTTLNVRVGIKYHLSSHTLIRGGKMRIDMPLSFRDKLRNPKVRQERIKTGGKTTILIRILRSC